MWNKIKRFNWTFLITWTVLIYLAYKLWSFIFSLIF